MKIFFDENFPPTIPEALDKLEQFDERNQIFSTSKFFKPGIKDPKLIRQIAKEKGVWITFDSKALKHHIKILKRSKVPVFAFDYGINHSYWEKTYLTLKHWRKIKELIQENANHDFYSFRVLKSTIKVKE